jgi:hypothetical protein
LLIEEGLALVTNNRKDWLTLMGDEEVIRGSS